MSQPVKEPASIFDMVTFGYKKAFKTLWPVTRICLPLLVVYAAGSGLIEAIASGLLPDKLRVDLHNLFSSALLVLNWSIACYARDAYWREAEPNPMTYLKPNRTLLGVAGIGLITAFYGIGAGLAGMLGLLLLVVPGIVIFSYFYIWSGLFYTVYLLEPENGVWAARHRVAALLRGYFKRTAGFGLLAGLVWLLAMTPVIFMSVGLELLKELPPSFFHATLFYGLYGLLDGAMEWFILAFGFTGYSFILNRYYDDLQVRREQAFNSVVNLETVRQADRQANG